MHNILTGDHGLKIAVFMNEYGEEQDMERQMLSEHEVYLVVPSIIVSACLLHSDIY